MMRLTTAQQQALWNNEKPVDGLHIVSARPGTGKTTTLTHYCEGIFDKWLDSYEPWQGIAILSYTNVARKELQKKIKVSGNESSLLAGANFIGTLDSFLNQYLFLPFAGPHMNGSVSRPALKGEPFGLWKPSQEIKNDTPANASSPVFFDCYTLDSHDNPIRTDASVRRLTSFSSRAAAKVSDTNARKIRNMKDYIWSLGYATQNDANYLALKVLRSSPEITRYLINRYPVLVIDEAQDMTEVQHAILDHLTENGLSNVVMIGDEYQAIYEWNTAKPQLFVDKKNDTSRWTSRSIDKTFRCSSNICAYLTQMANDSVELLPEPLGKSTEYGDAVRILEYTHGPQENTEIRQHIDDTAAMLASKSPHSDNIEDIKSLAILTRSRDDADKIEGLFNSGNTPSWSFLEWDYEYTRPFLKVVYYLSLGNIYKAFDAYESLIQVTNDYPTKSDMRNDLIANNFKGVVKDYRKLLFDDLNNIKDTFSAQDIRISDCASLSTSTNIAINADVWESIINECNKFRNEKSAQDRPISNLFSSNEERNSFYHPDHSKVLITISTIHGVKGETYDGVFLFTKDQTGSCTCDPPKRKWSVNLTHNIVECENKRLAYVAASRAAQLLCIAAPTLSVSAWQALDQAGV